jgi:hypothetical protein
MRLNGIPNNTLCGEVKYAIGSGLRRKVAARVSMPYVNLRTGIAGTRLEPAIDLLLCDQDTSRRYSELD